MAGGLLRVLNLPKGNLVVIACLGHNTGPEEEL